MIRSVIMWHDLIVKNRVQTALAKGVESQSVAQARQKPKRSQKSLDDIEWL
jgi:hypothetical protein